MSYRPPAPPPELSGFDFVRHLGSGGFADVYLYEEQNLGRRQVAVKVLLRGELADRALENFGNEATLMARLSNHPSIVSVYQAGISADGRPFIVMEYCSKPTLHARYRAARFSEAETLRVGIQIAGAIETAHRAGILHRDIKPANVLVTDYGRPALTDFGIAATVGSDAAVGLSVPWAPPEAVGSGRVADARSDVYSLAATLYTVLAGRTPFEIPGESNTAADLMGRIRTAALPRIERADLSPSVENLLATGLARDPKDRHPSAMAFARALQKVQIEHGMQPTTVDVMDEAIGVERVEDGGRTVVRSGATLGSRPPAPPRGIVAPERAAETGEHTMVRPEVDGVAATQLRRTAKERIDEEAIATTPDRGIGTSATGSAPSRRHWSQRRGFIVGGVVAALAGAGALGLMLSQAGSPASSPMATAGAPHAETPAAPTFTCWNGKSVHSLERCGRATGIEGLKYVYPSLVDQWKRCKYVDLLPTTDAFECGFADGVIRYRYWKNVKEANDGIAERYATAQRSELILDGKSVGAMYRPTSREGTGLFAMLAQWGDGHFSLTITAKTRAQQERLWNTVRFRAVADLRGVRAGETPRVAVRA